VLTTSNEISRKGIVMIKITLLVGAALTLAACGAAQPTADPATPSQAETPVVAPTPSTSPAASPPGSPSEAGSPVASADPCPVSEGTLLKALKGTDIGRAGGSPTKLINIKCYKGYAMARDGGSPGPGERAYFLFGFKSPQDVWVPLNVGTDDLCQRFVLDRTTREHLGEGCSA
jgi:hypothetical protein